MTPIERSVGSFLAGAAVTASVLVLAPRAAPDVLNAQGKSKPTVMKRIYTGTDGLSHVEDILLDPTTLMEKVSSVEVRVSPPGRFSDWHVAPQRQYIVNLSGVGQLEVVEGKVDLPPGSIEYIDDLTGKGHTTRTLGTNDRVSLWIKFDDQKPHIGPLAATNAVRP
jgi:hypothetical protein